MSILNHWLLVLVWRYARIGLLGVSLARCLGRSWGQSYTLTFLWALMGSVLYFDFPLEKSEVLILTPFAQAEKSEVLIPTPFALTLQTRYAENRDLLLIFFIQGF